MSRGLTRRRLLVVAGAAAGLPLLSGAAARDVPIYRWPIYRWHGVALGAPAAITLAHPDAGAAQRIVGVCLAEIARLERVFSLFLAGSELSRLNQDGRLSWPSLDLLAVLTESRRLSALTTGAFDPTVQPLWTLFAGHFARRPDGPGPDAGAVAAARARVDWRALEAEPRAVSFARPNMAATLNGIAQGYITDRVADLLRDQGIDRVLLDLGETRALGSHPTGRPWRVGLADPTAVGRPRDELALVDEAVASSGGYGTRFDRTGQHHHLFDPASGQSTSLVQSVSVIAGRATVADALATALCIAPESATPALLHAAGARAAHIVRLDGRVVVVRAERRT